MGQQFSPQYPHGGGNPAISIFLFLSGFVWIPVILTMSIASSIRAFLAKSRIRARIMLILLTLSAGLQYYYGFPSTSEIAVALLVVICGACIDLVSDRTLYAWHMFMKEENVFGHQNDDCDICGHFASGCSICNGL